MSTGAGLAGLAAPGGSPGTGGTATWKGPSARRGQRTPSPRCDSSLAPPAGGDNTGVGRRQAFAISSALAAVLMAGCATASPAAPGPPPGTGPTATATATTASARVHVAPCPVPAGDYAGTPYSPHPAAATVSLPASLALPRDAQVFGTWFLPGSTGYLIGPKSANCQGYLASADGGEIMTATPGMRMTISPGGAGPSTDLACPYIPAVRAADEAFRQSGAFCRHPAADVIRQIPTGTAGLYAAAVLVPARVKDPGIMGSGDGTDPAVALYTARVTGTEGAAGQTIACTLAPAQGDVCAASLTYFLLTQGQIRTGITAANLRTMRDDLSSFLAEHGIQ